MAAQVDAAHVHLEDSPPPLWRHVPRALVFAAADAGVRNQQMERSELLLGLGHHPLDGRTIADVDLEREPADLVRHIVDLLACPRGYRHAGPGVCELPRDPGADAAAAARDERYLACQVISRRHEAGG
jgi:hypothetical protein